MSHRTLLELNHDYCPPDDPEKLLEWAKVMQLYLKSGDREFLPLGVTFFWRRHHSDPCPFEQPLEFERRTRRLADATEKARMKR